MNVIIKGYFYINTDKENVKDAVRELENRYPDIEIGGIDYLILRDEDGNDIEKYDGSEHKIYT